jgi:tetratricopeptide (TPR) repeat protein
LGNALKEQGRLEEAEASYRQAISLESDYAEAHSNLGNTLQELGKLDAAEASLRQSITLEPNSLESLSNLGAILQQGGNLEEAEACYRQSVALNPERAEAHRHLASMKKFNLRDEQYMQMPKYILTKMHGQTSVVRLILDWPKPLKI